VQPSLAAPSSPRSAAVLAPGTRLGRYELIRRLAIGGMAELYLARSTGIAGFEKLVALKRILPQYAEADDFVAMFLDEARLAATIHHSNVAQVYDIGSDADGLYFTMEYVHGVDLRAIVSTVVKRGELVPLEHALAIAIGAAAGLHAAHELTAPDGAPLSLVHRDVSPSNVLVSYGGCVKIIDFGVVKAARRQTETRAGTLKGKIAYMSPEQCMGADLDRRSDVFSLGILLWEMTTGVRLFAAESEYALLRQIVDHDAPRPSTVRADYPADLEAIVMRALSRSRDDRYATAQELQLALEELARRRCLSVSSVQLGSFVRGLFPDRAAERADGTLSRSTMATGTPPRVPSLSELDAVEGGGRVETWMFDEAPATDPSYEPMIDRHVINRLRRSRALVAAAVMAVALSLVAAVLVVLTAQVAEAPAPSAPAAVAPMVVPRVRVPVQPKVAPPAAKPARVVRPKPVAAPPPAPAPQPPAAPAPASVEELAAERAPAIAADRDDEPARDRARNKKIARPAKKPAPRSWNPDSALPP